MRTFNSSVNVPITLLDYIAISIDAEKLNISVPELIRKKMGLYDLTDKRKKIPVDYKYKTKSNK